MKNVDPLQRQKPIHHALILGDDKVGVMTIIFKQHSADGEGLAEKQGVLSIVLQGGSREEEITSTACPSRKEPPPLRRWDLADTFTSSSFVISLNVYNSQAQPSRRLDARPNRPRIVRKRCHDRMLHLFGASSGQTVEVTPIQSRRRPPFDNQSIRTRTECRATRLPQATSKPSATDSFLKKRFFFFPRFFYFSRFLFFSSFSQMFFSFFFCSFDFAFLSENSFHALSQRRCAWRWR